MVTAGYEEKPVRSVKKNYSRVKWRDWGFLQLVPTFYLSLFPPLAALLIKVAYGG
jgi:hypothetical protein